MKSPIKWAGGKSWLVSTVKELYQQQGSTRLVEPFCGSCAITFGIEPPKALLNDICQPLINFYQVLAEGRPLKFDKYRLTEEEYYKSRFYFNKRKREFKTNPNKVALAHYFYYLNKAGFNGLYRENKKGEFNVPWGKRKSIPPITIAAEDLKNYEFSCREYQDLAIAPSDFLFVDPPYDTEFTNYSRTGFSFEDQDKLVWWLRGLNVPFVLTNQATDRIIEMYKDYELKLKFVEAPRRIKGKGDRASVIEVIATNFSPEKSI